MLRTRCFLLLLVVGCAPSTPALTPASAKVTLAKSAPPPGYVGMGPVAVQSGKGCGVMGQPGSKPDAEARLRIAADKLGASYVHVTNVETPHPNHQCMEHEYK